jgi:hypothetical protein
MCRALSLQAESETAWLALICGKAYHGRRSNLSRRLSQMSRYKGRSSKQSR